MRVDLERVSKEFFSLRGRIAALREVDLAVADGEFFVLLGPSGSGKSTLLNLIAGLEVLTSGRIRFGETVVADAERRLSLSPRRRNVAFVFQSYALYPHLNVYENIAFPLRIARESKERIRQAVERAAETLNISDLLPARPAELSGGQRQRVAIARAIVRQPSVFLMDEPLSNLDAQLRAAMRVELKTLQRRLGVTTVYVTHDQVEALSLGDRVAVLRDGRLEQVGTPRDLYERPASPFVGRFVGSPPMNLLPARLEGEAGRLYVCLEGVRLRVPREKEEEFRARGDRTVLLGIRPEHVRIAAPGPGRTASRVRAVEPLGREAVVHLSVAGRPVLALAGEAEVAPDLEVGVEFDLGRAHLFPADSAESAGGP